MTNYWNAAANQSASPNNWAFSVTDRYQQLSILIEERKDLDTTIDVGAYTGNGTTDSALYDVIAMPYGSVRITNPSAFLYGITTDKDRSLKVMTALAEGLGTANVLDLQLLPYCPVPELVREDAVTHEKYILFTSQENKTVIMGYKQNVGYTDAIFVCPSHMLTFDIEKPITISDTTSIADTYKKKYLNDCTVVRLCSPNYNGLFEFNLAKNGMAVDNFNVDLTMKPFNPYIHVNPNFKNLYGQDFNDIRGLICGGDFSLGLINDAWVSYEIQNKNYQALFDRQIQNLDRNNSIAQNEAIITGALGTIRGGIEGAITGGLVGGGYGAAAGAVIGTGTSGAGAAMDYMHLQQRQKEERNYAIDRFNLQLGNVKALPNSITKTSALTNNNKLFPFVEIYECTPEEKEAYYNKLKYDGMTIGKIGYIGPFMGTNEKQYFKGRLIRCESILENNHVFEAINDELEKGVYI